MPVDGRNAWRLLQRPGIYPHPNLVSLTPEEAAQVKGPTEEEVQEALERGQRAKDAALANRPSQVSKGIRYR